MRDFSKTIHAKFGNSMSVNPATSKGGADNNTKKEPNSKNNSSKDPKKDDKGKTFQDYLKEVHNRMKNKG